MAADLPNTAALWKIDPKGACLIKSVELHAPLLQLGAKLHSSQLANIESDHAELSARYEFECASAQRPPMDRDVFFFNRFARVYRMRMQLVTPQRQKQEVLRKPQRKVALPI